ncbi:endoglucanase V-like protein, partial [Gymnopilus junonius]
LPLPLGVLFCRKGVGGHSTGERVSAGGYVQLPSGSASFTMYTGCNQPACGKAASGYTAAINQLAFGSAPGTGPGDACGRCFALTGSADPYSPSFTGPFTSIIVKVTDMCPVAGNQEWCGQTKSTPTNQYGKNFHFDICEDTGGSAVFFPSGHGALTGTFTEVACSQWSGSDGGSLWNGSCLSGETAANWPSGVGCGNQGGFLFLFLALRDLSFLLTVFWCEGTAPS